MKINKHIFVAVAAVAGLAMTACTKEDTGTDAVKRETLVTVKVADYETPDGTAGNDSAEEMDDIRACVFENGILTSVYHPSVEASGDCSFIMERTGGRLYVIANAGRIRDFESMCTVPSANSAVYQQITMVGGLNGGLKFRI